ncbi:molybdopterin molybdotransferase MoeA [Sphingosinithalassobacter portus]|uniref:molybdopterin molybdotransferase MoeA n=1 Tax=Stakelama portus TaxID=2676234 RepID=UPI000D6E795C|nr:molybdopterin molybdotransferase MoeA [Sphingosinithalassobacter portus]
MKPDVATALDWIEAACVPAPLETIALRAAAGRITGAPVHAVRPFPRFAMAAMDGYALSSADTVGASALTPVRLPIGPEVLTGKSGPPTKARMAYPINTGAALPDCTDSVVARERAKPVPTPAGDILSIEAPIASGLNRREAGEDAAAGEIVLAAGRRVTPDAMAALTAYGVTCLQVRRVPRLGLFSTGDEIAREAAAPGEHQHADSNRPMIEAAAEYAGIPVTFLGHISEQPAHFETMLAGAIASSDADILLSTGAVSAGTRDLIRPALKALGAEILLHGIAMRPGKPLLVAKLPDGRLYFGLPGNPVAALLGFRFFVFAALRRMFGLKREAGISARFEATPRAGTTLFARGRLENSLEGARFCAEADQRSHVMRSVLASDSWARIDDDACASGVCRVYPKFPSLLA